MSDSKQPPATVGVYDTPDDAAPHAQVGLPGWIKWVVGLLILIAVAALIFWIAT
jgi:hypothetical protein